MKSLLLGTDIWLDYHIESRPGHEDAFELVGAALRAECPLFVAAHSLSEFWSIFWQTGAIQNTRSGSLNPEAASLVAKNAAWAALEQIGAIATVVGSDASDAWMARKLGASHNNYSDNLVVAAAMRTKADLLVTNNAALLRHCPTACASAQDARAFLEL